MGNAAVGDLYAPPNIVREDRRDGSIVLRSADPLDMHPVSVLHSLRSWAAADPDHPLVAERDADGGWRTLSYGQAATAAASVGQALLDRGLGPDRPMVVLSGNSVDHLVVALGAMTAGIPVAPTSVAYSLQSKDHARIRELAELTDPGMVFAEDAERFLAPLDALGGVPAVVSRGHRDGAENLDDLLRTAPGSQVEAAFEAIRSDTVAKILFTSGSTGSPKGVLTTHGMLSANQQMMRQAWPFLADERMVIVDWLPWSHTFGGSHNLNMVIVSGGTLYIDGGRPAPGMFAQTLENLADVPPTVYFNVPAGYAQLVPVLESNRELAQRFFSRLRLIFNAAAALPEALHDRIGRVALETTGREVPATGSWGLTETAPAVTTNHYRLTDSRSIGVPLPGTEVLLKPVEDAFEIRVRGPWVTPGYLGRPDLTGEAFDAEGFYRTGDAVVPADDSDPNEGLLFRGRIAEDFKLQTGTFVRVGAVRTSLLSAVPLLSDAVIAGENQEYVGALAWVDTAEARRLFGEDPAVDGDLLTDEHLLEHVAAALAEHQPVGSAGRVERLLLMSSPAVLDSGEITDKGYVNQRKVLRNRAALVDLLFDDPPAAALVVRAAE